MSMHSHGAETIAVGWNQTAREYPRDCKIPELFEAQVRVRPLAVALVGDKGEVTYAELNRRANKLAHWLQSQGLRPGDLAALCLPRGGEFVVTVLAVLKVGAAYLPLDSADPCQRLASLLADVRPAALLTTTRLQRRLNTLGVRTLALDTPSAAAEILEQADDDPRVVVAPDSLCYVMATSGSTGRPKGVMVPHRAVIRLVHGTDYVAFGPDRTFLQLAPTCFDASTFELWGSLLHGAKLVLAPDGAPDPHQIATLIERHAVCTLWLTAGLFNMLVEVCPRLFRRLQQLIVGGEALSPRHVRLADALLPNGARLINGYGPTEGTTFTCCHAVMRPLPDGSESIPIGRPIANTRVYVLDEAGRPLGIGAVGELYIGGDGLALGYLNDPELTAARFVVKQLPGSPDERLYRSGDRVRWRSDGVLEFLGRLDDQVKIRGHRIEPAEVERALQSHAQVDRAVVVARQASAGENRLVAYYTVRAFGDVAGRDATESTKEPPAAELRTHLRGLLPEVMQPAALVRLAKFPLNANGKVDRAALPSPEALPAERSAGELGLRTADERAMAGLWTDVLSITGIGGHDHFFFDLAGNSLLAAQVIDRVNRRFCVKLSMHDLLTTPTVVSLTARVTASANVTRAAVPHLEVIRNGRGYDPVVCVGFSNVLPVLQAALAADVPLWWLKLDGLHGPPYAVRPVAEIVSGYANELSAAGVQRVTLVGHSYCGLIAFDLTRRLRRAGMTVHTLLLEPSLPEMFARGHQGMPDDPRLSALAWPESEPVEVPRLRRLMPTGATLRSCGIWLAERTKRRAQKSLLRPYLKLTVRLGRELPPRHRQWWYYGSQIMRRIKQFEILRSPGPFWLAGQSAYLTTYADSWQAHVDGELAQCPLPAARCHAEVLEQPAAAPWLAVVRAYAEGGEPAADGSLDRAAA